MIGKADFEVVIEGDGSREQKDNTVVGGWRGNRTMG
jgi:hypothetical protein